MTGAQLLLVEDDTAMRQMLESLFTGEGYSVSEAASAQDALSLARNRDFDVVLSDIKMPGKSGIELVGELRELQPTTPVVLMTAFGTSDTAVDALRVGAFDYTPKPFEPSDVLRTIGRAVERHELEVRVRARSAERHEASAELVARSEAMRDVVAIVRRAAQVDAPVLISGESGTGKEVVARALHEKSARGSKPFVRLHCGAYKELVEGQLFGRVASNGSGTAQRSLFEAADGGTLFLDSVGELPHALQAQLARVIQEHEVCAVGSTQPVSVDVRVIAATDRDLDVEMEAGRFREDLYYRLNVIPLRLRPLRERPDDVPALVEVFTRRHSPGRERRFSQAALRRLQAYPWRSNARELSNVVERTLSLTDADLIHAEDLPLDETLDAQAADSALMLGLSEAARMGFTLRDVEDRFITRTLAYTGGRKGEAAHRLGIDRKTLYRRAHTEDTTH